MPSKAFEWRKASNQHDCHGREHMLKATEVLDILWIDIHNGMRFGKAFEHARELAKEIDDYIDNTECLITAMEEHQP